MSNLQTYYHFKLDFQKVDQHFHILMPYNIILYFPLPYFHVSNNALFST